MRIFRTVPSILSLCIATAVRAFTQEAYVWQRQFTPAVYASASSMGEKVDGFAVLAAEIRWSGKEPVLFKSPVSYAQLAAAGRPVAAVLRVGPYAGIFARDDFAASYLVQTATAIVTTARGQGVTLSELQVDFDCASSKLAGYAEWVKVLRAAVAPTKLVFTALPDWLARQDFSSLAHAADGYVLQVHSVEKPAGIEADFKLCDPKRSWEWIARATQMGVPFRVALPTYGYRLAFDESGNFFGLAAEGVSPSWPKGTRVRYVRADVDAMVALAAKISAARLANCTGIIWFRLPVAGDELNWDLLTFRAVLGGRIPASHLAIESKWTSPGLVEISVVNTGERTETLPAKIVTRWGKGEPPQTLDGLGGYLATFDSSRRDSITLTPGPAVNENGVAPGRARKIGWLHFNHETTLFSEITASP